MHCLGHLTEDLRAMGITPSMVRPSLGTEHPEDTFADLKQALDAVLARRVGSRVQDGGATGRR